MTFSKPNCGRNKKKKKNAKPRFIPATLYILRDINERETDIRHSIPFDIVVSCVLFYWCLQQLANKLLSSHEISFTPPLSHYLPLSPSLPMLSSTLSVHPSLGMSSLPILYDIFGFDYFFLCLTFVQLVLLKHGRVSSIPVVFTFSLFFRVRLMHVLFSA